MATNLGAINFNGVVSGLNTSSIIDALVQANSGYLNRVTRQQSDLNSHRDLFGKVTAALQSLRTAAQAINSANGFSPVAATVSDANVLTAAAGSGAAAGTYKIEVKAVAQAQHTYSDAVASSSASGLLGSGTLTLTDVNQTVHTLNVDSSTTLQSVNTWINGAGAGVTSSIVYDGTNYRLSIVGGKTGAAQAFSFSDSGTTTGLSSGANTVQAAQDATVVLDNVATVSRPTNTFSDVISGVSLQVQAASPALQTLTLQSDAATAMQGVQAYVDAYNKVVQTVSAATVSSTDPKTGKVVYNPAQLAGDSTLRSLMRDLQGSLVALQGGGTPYDVPSQLGITTGADGTLSIDSKKLSAALTANPNAVAHVFVQDFGSNTKGVAARAIDLADTYASTATGTISKLMASIDNQARRMNGQIDFLQSNLDAYRSALQAEFTKLEANLAQMQSQTSYLKSLTDK